MIGVLVLGFRGLRFFRGQPLIRMAAQFLLGTGNLRVGPVHRLVVIEGCPAKNAHCPRFFLQ